MKTLDFSNDLSLPINAVTQKLAFLGISGSGKTYGSGKFTEELLFAGAQVVVIDTIGNWWGLRLGPDGKKPGISIPILGGERGDVALEASHGKLVAETIAGTKSPLIVDVSDFTGGEMRRFVTEFAVELLRLKKKHPSPVMVVWEECQDIVPQRVMGETAKMVGAVEKLIKKGRNYGVGTVLISQRAAAVNKDVLNQVETIMCFRLNAKHDRKAIEDWIVEKDIDVGELVDELPTLPTGTCFCWSPQWLKTLKRVKVGKKKTFDASATPEFGEELKAGALAPVDLEKFKKSMGAAIEQAKANDPELLKKKIGELQAQVKKLEAQKPEAKTEVKKVTVPVLKEHEAGALKKLTSRLLEDVPALKALLTSILEEVNKFDKPVFHRKAPAFAPKTFFLNEQHELPPKPLVPRMHGKETAKRTIQAARAASNGEAKIDGGARRMLQQLAMRDPIPTTRTQLATLAVMSPNSGTYATYLSQLNTAGFIQKVDGGFVITEAGHFYLGGDVPQAPQTKDELVDLWCSKLDGKAKDMLRVIVDAGEAGVGRSVLAEAVGLSENSGTYATYLSSLNSNGLIKKQSGVFMPSSLFT